MPLLDVIHPPAPYTIKNHFDGCWEILVWHEVELLQVRLPNTKGPGASPIGCWVYGYSCDRWCSCIAMAHQKFWLGQRVYLLGWRSDPFHFEITSFMTPFCCSEGLLNMPWQIRDIVKYCRLTAHQSYLALKALVCFDLWIDCGIVSLGVEGTGLSPGSPGSPHTL